MNTARSQPIMEASLLQSDDHRLFLDSVDELRSKGFSNYVDLPQIIVCGDQSAGKSSVLNAVSGMSFPSKDSLCTRFATELMLRRDSEAAVKVSIIPGQERTEDEVKELLRFSADVDVDIYKPDIGPVIEKAKIAMGICDAKRFSSDILRVELSGPTRPHLTLVDLPGIFRAGSKDQSVSDAPTVIKLVEQSMMRPRSVIVAVVSAKADLNLQDITELARKLDPQGKRTMGLITKPDTLPVGSDSEASYIRLAQNKDVVYQLGWHVLRNRDYDTRDASQEERDTKEEEFFKTGVWASIDPGILGVKTLKARLSQILTHQILLQLPSLLQDVEIEISKRNDLLRRLGPPRATVEEQRRYLYQVSQSFSSLMKAAVDGVYDDEFFISSETDEGYYRRLRAVIQNQLTDFEDDLRENGQTRVITEEEEKDAADKRQITRTEYIAKVKVLMSGCRGRELPGTFNPLIIGELFTQQCQPWTDIAVCAKESIVKRSKNCTKAILDHVAVDLTADAIMRMLGTRLDLLRAQLDEQLDKLLLPHFRSHPITYNHYLTDTVQQMQSERRMRKLREIMQAQTGISDIQANMEYDTCDLSDILTALNRDLEPNMENYAADLAVDYMEAYYKVARKRFVDDVSTLAIEETFVRGLSKLFTPEMVHQLSQEEVKQLAGEGSQSVAQRTRYGQELAVLEEGLRNLKKLDRHWQNLSDDQADGGEDEVDGEE